jgi:hypothetical protein
MPVKNRIAAVGLELEGGWLTNPPFPLQQDNSVKFPVPPIKRPGTFRNRDEEVAWLAAARAEMEKHEVPYTGEITTGANPLPPQLVAIEAWVRTHYPQKVNETCGLHVHTSFIHKLNYQRLMTPDFTTAMIKALREWAEEEKLPKDHPLMPRIWEKDHLHCAHVYCGEEQAKMERKDYHSRGKPHSRYTAINYCFAQHKTVECRLLSMFETPEQAVRAIMTVVDTTNAFLAKVRMRELKIRAAVRPTPSTIMRHRAVIR